MKNKVVVIDAAKSAYRIQEEINEWLDKGWLVELFYEARAEDGNKIIVTLFRED